MKCQRCNERDATVQIVQKHMNGKEESLALCSQCANELGITFSAFAASQDALPFSLFNDFFQQHLGFNNLDGAEKEELVCSSCGTTLKDFRRKGILGCSQCYEAFSAYISPIFGKIQMGHEHKGREIGKIANIEDKKDEALPIVVPEKEAEKNVEKKVTVRKITKKEEVNSLPSKEVVKVSKKELREQSIKEKEKLLKKAIEEEDYKLAAEIRDELRGVREKK